MNFPTPDDDQAMRESLQRDAARVPEPAFDAALHYATMRRVRAQAKGSRPRIGVLAGLTTAGAVLAVSALVFFRWPHSTTQMERREVASSAPAPALNVRASLFAYQTAAGGGEATLFAMLDRDASSLLPPTSPVFDGVLP